MLNSCQFPVARKRKVEMLSAYSPSLAKARRGSGKWKVKISVECGVEENL